MKYNQTPYGMNKTQISIALLVTAGVLSLAGGYIWYGMQTASILPEVSESEPELIDESEPDAPEVGAMTVEERDQMLERMQDLEPMTEADHDAMMQLLNQ